MILPIGSAVQAEPMFSALSGEISVSLPYEQIPLTPRAGIVIVFIGGVGDEFSGIMHYLYEDAPALTFRRPENRAYYHWHAGIPLEFSKAPALIASHIVACRAVYPRVDVVLIGHSMGAATALKVAQLLEPAQGRVFLVTLDPIDRTTLPTRPRSLMWWGNGYVTNSRSTRDLILRLGGRWGKCESADLNIRFDGNMQDELGYFYIHDHACSMFMSRVAGGGVSLADELSRLLAQPEKRPRAGAAARE